MPLLTDAQLKDELRAHPEIIQDLDTTDWSHLGSHIQPCSAEAPQLFADFSIEALPDGSPIVAQARHVSQILNLPRLRWSTLN